MTAQIPERLIDGGVEVEMVTCPPWPQRHRAIKPTMIEPEGILNSTACWRHYQGTWEIRVAQLWLTALEGRWSKATPEPLLADWITGVLHVWHGEVLAYVHMGFASLYERDELIGIRRGIVVGRAMIDNRQDPPADPDDHRARLRAAMPDGLTCFADEDPAESIEILRCEIAGTGHHCDDDTGHRLARTPVLALVREPENEHDPDAIAVHLDGRKVGYIPRRHNAVLAKMIDAGKRLRARVEQVMDPEAGPWLDVQVVVEMEG